MNLNPDKPRRRTFGLLALIAGVVLILLELNRLRRGGEVEWFWVLVAAVAVVLGSFDVLSGRGGERGR